MKKYRWQAGHGGRAEGSWVQGHYFNISKQNTEKASIKTGAQHTSPGITDQDKVPTKQKSFMTNTAKDTERRTLPPRQGWFGLLWNQVCAGAHGWAPSYPQELKTHKQGKLLQTLLQDKLWYIQEAECCSTRPTEQTQMPMSTRGKTVWKAGEGKPKEAVNRPRDQKRGDAQGALLVGSKAILCHNNGGDTPLYIRVSDFSKQLLPSVRSEWDHVCQRAFPTVSDTQCNCQVTSQYI